VTVNAEQHALVAFGDIEGPNRPVLAEQVFSRLFRNAYWLIARPSRVIAPGVRMLFYQNEIGFRGHAVVAEIMDNSQRAPFGNDIFLAFSQEVRLTDCHEFLTPVSARALVHDLDFVANKKYWGHAFRSTPRSISQGDYMTIVRAARRLEDKKDA
jgi:hypothetical protein